MALQSPHDVGDTFASHSSICGSNPTSRNSQMRRSSLSVSFRITSAYTNKNVGSANCLQQVLCVLQQSFVRNVGLHHGSLRRSRKIGPRGKDGGTRSRVSMLESFEHSVQVGHSAMARHALHNLHNLVCGSGVGVVLARFSFCLRVAWREKLFGTEAVHRIVVCRWDSKLSVVLANLHLESVHEGFHRGRNFGDLRQRSHHHSAQRWKMRPNEDPFDVRGAVDISTIHSFRMIFTFIVSCRNP